LTFSHPLIFDGRYRSIGLLRKQTHCRRSVLTPPPGWDHMLLPWVAKEFEVSMYRKAATIEEYKDLSTLRKRLKSLVERIRTTKKPLSSLSSSSSAAALAASSSNKGVVSGIVMAIPDEVEQMTVELKKWQTNHQPKLSSPQLGMKQQIASRAGTPTLAKSNSNTATCTGGTKYSHPYEAHENAMFMAFPEHIASSSAMVANSPPLDHCCTPLESRIVLPPQNQEIETEGQHVTKRHFYASTHRFAVTCSPLIREMASTTDGMTSSNQRYPTPLNHEPAFYGRTAGSVSSRILPTRVVPPSTTKTKSHTGMPTLGLEQPWSTKMAYSSPHRVVGHHPNENKRQLPHQQRSYTLLRDTTDNFSVANMDESSKRVRRYVPSPKEETLVECNPKFAMRRKK
jgi:hypothetical protein